MNSIIDCFRTDDETIVTVAKGKDTIGLTLANDQGTIYVNLTKRQTARVLKAIVAGLTNTEDEI
jgi:hypothetical protein